MYILYYDIGDIVARRVWNGISGQYGDHGVKDGRIHAGGEDIMWREEQSRNICSEVQSIAHISSKHADIPFPLSNVVIGLAEIGALSI